MFRTVKPRQIVVDVSIAAACALIEIAISGSDYSTIALVGMATALALRRLSPALALCLVWPTALLQVFLTIGPDMSNLAILPVLYATASYGSSLLRWAGLFSSGLGALVLTIYFWWPVFGPADTLITESSRTQSIPLIAITFFSAFAVFALSWALGLLARTWRTSRESVKARVLAESARLDAQQSVIVEQERNRIARDMHDVVAHSLAVVIAQADGARYAREADPSAVDDALATIASTAREALGDVRILLGQLRHSQESAPQPVLADLDRLYAQMTSAGLPLKVESSGEPQSLPCGVQLAVYRIVQEALTNALRHGGAEGDTTVSFHWQEKSLLIDIINPLAPGSSGNATSPGSSGNAGADDSDVTTGHGLAGMTERATLIGGSLVAQPDGGKFVIAVTVPLAQSEVPA